MVLHLCSTLVRPQLEHCALFGSPAQERHGHPRASAAQASQAGPGDGALGTGEQADRCEFAKPRQKVGQGTYCSLKLFNGRIKRQTVLKEEQWKDARHHRHAGVQEIRLKKDGWLELEVQRSCENCILAVIPCS